MISKYFIAAVSLTCSLACGAVGFAADTPAEKTAGYPKIVYIENHVSVNLSGDTWVDAQKDMVLNENAGVKTDEGAYCDISLDESNGNIISLGPQTEVKLGEYLKSIRITQGRVFSQLKNLKSGSQFEIVTPQAIAGVRGTSWETIVSTLSKFNVKDHAIYVNGLTPAGKQTGETNVAEGYSIEVSQDGWMGELKTLTAEDQKRMEDWSNRIDQALQSSLSKKGCGGLIDNYQGGSSSLFLDVLQCEAGNNQEAFASAANDLVLLGNDSSAQGITNGDITTTTITNPPDNPPLAGPETPPKPTPQPSNTGPTAEPPPAPPSPPGGGGQGCFLKGTPITMADGTTKPIEEIKAGDVVLSFDQAAGRMKPDRVTAIFAHPHENVYFVINNILKVTPNHPVLSKGKWSPVEELKVGDVLTNAQGQDVAIMSKVEVKKPVNVYNIEVNPYHTYVANGFIVHNKKALPNNPEYP